MKKGLDIGKKCHKVFNIIESIQNNARNYNVQLGNGRYTQGEHVKLFCKVQNC